MKKSEIFSLSKVVKYQNDSIISRILIDKKSGSVTLFAFDKDQSLSEHTSPYDALAHVIDGKVEVTISDKSFILEKGDIIIMPAEIPHAVKAIDQFKMLLIMIRD